MAYNSWDYTCFGICYEDLKGPGYTRDGSTFQDEMRGVAPKICTACPVGKTVAEKCLPTADRQCVCSPTFMLQEGGKFTCPAGETLMGTECKLCEKDKWKFEPGVQSCTRCSLDDSTTLSEGSTSETDCICPAGKYDNGKKKCVDIVEGMNETATGMTLANVTLERGWWRTDAESTDVRECPVAEACVGGNSAEDYCREGHNGPYCGVCGSGFFKSPLSVCKSCPKSVVEIAMTVVFVVVAISETAKVFNVDLLSLVPVGCMVGDGFNYYDFLLMTTLIIISICGLLVLAGVKNKNKRVGFFNSAIAVTYFTFPSVTTTIWAVFPCEHFDDETSNLHIDLSVDFNGGKRVLWVVYGIFMVLIFPGK
ncbi:hypothetical protein TL16_g01382 [Triparma laevis f. inornata]|uniref:Tyrosine-protein kinase ephrin type A/B receptor-like domain-containing protein n=1 Tax=Triparma laevis f. inornata TaxID=1714386 RepID=A0A9W6ZJB5_9STRA|nr:hypothetical protein TL16_g01382 [Triparma laevis f. inornata]